MKLVELQIEGYSDLESLYLMDDKTFNILNNSEAVLWVSEQFGKHSEGRYTLYTRVINDNVDKELIMTLFNKRENQFKDGKVMLFGHYDFFYSNVYSLKSGETIVEESEIEELESNKEFEQYLIYGLQALEKKL